MSFLAPLYALAALSIGLPLIFHLIRRQPRGEMTFSSLMFIDPSPPQIAKKGRLDNLLLLFLRALAILLLAISFSRPFFRQTDQTTTAPAGRSTLVLVDRSASMRRDTLWQQASKQIDEVLAESDEGDQLSLGFFDSQFELVYSGKQFDTHNTVRQIECVRHEFEQQSPGWNRTDLGAAIIQAIDALHATTESNETQMLRSQIVIVSDLQEGTALEKLQSFEWPDDVWVQVRQVIAAEPSNAFATFLLRDESAKESLNGIPLRLSNSSDATTADFEIGFQLSDGQLSPEKQSIHIPPASSRNVELPTPSGPETIHRITLFGDAQPFDNTIWVQITAARTRRLLFVGEAHDDPRMSLFFYLQKAPLDTPWQTVTVERITGEDLSAIIDPNTCPLIVLQQPATTRVDELQKYLFKGGQVLVVLSEPIVDNDPWQPFIHALVSQSTLRISEAKVDDYSMLSTIDFQHLLLQPFAGAQFNDFTKIRCWSRRKLVIEPDTADDSLNSLSPWRTLARFDDSSPALLEQKIGEGTVWILGSGWQPEQSQLALSTKFVPLILGMFDQTLGRPAVRQTYTVGEILPIADGASVRTPSDREHFGNDSLLNHQLLVSEVGVYKFTDNNTGKAWQAVANLPSDESRTSPLTPDVLESFGVKLGQAPNRAELAETDRQKRDVELEQSQSVWKWLLVAVVAILFTETVLGATSRRGVTRT